MCCRGVVKQRCEATTAPVRHFHCLCLYCGLLTWAQWVLAKHKAQALTAMQKLRLPICATFCLGAAVYSLFRAALHFRWCRALLVCLILGLRLALLPKKQ